MLLCGTSCQSLIIKIYKRCIVNYVSAARMASNKKGGYAMKVVKGWTVFILCIFLSACAGSTEEEVPIEQRSESSEPDIVEKEIRLCGIGEFRIHDREYEYGEMG